MEIKGKESNLYWHQCVNLLCGVGLLSTPYAVKQGGWAGLSILAFFCVVSFYTGILLRCCLDSKPGLQSYPDIGQAAFGIIGRLVVSCCS
ncbi:putative amino acid transporter, transmembrane domain-containing protein [Helianthus annuus]|nr:putative amino acid transporter, transmembrane domain-containing protein [Helianthus annuus]